MIDRITVDKILDAAQIVDVVSDFVTLRKAGVNYKGLCPFHDDRTPSFVVSPAKGLCKCFACGKGGNAVHFIMEHEQLSYPDALRYLARKYHIEIKERELTDDEKQAQSERESMFVINEWACKFFQDQLKKNFNEDIAPRNGTPATKRLSAKVSMKNTFSRPVSATKKTMDRLSTVSGDA